METFKEFIKEVIFPVFWVLCSLILVVLFANYTLNKPVASSNPDFPNQSCIIGEIDSSGHFEYFNIKYVYTQTPTEYFLGTIDALNEKVVFKRSGISKKFINDHYVITEKFCELKNYRFVLVD